MPAAKSPDVSPADVSLDRALMAHIDELLDEALVETFPASDPISICIEQPATTGRKGTSPALRPREHQ